MGLSDFKKAGILTIVLVVTTVCIWEFYLRSKGVSFSFDDNEALWAYERSQIYKEPDATFFIGASRIKFDLDIQTWENITGEKAVQLALVGTSPQLILQDLANDEKFTGKLIVDITEMVIYSRDPGDQANAKKSIEYYKKLTPAQRLSFYIDYALQSTLVFLESKKFSLNGVLSELHFPGRKGVPVFHGFPVGFEPTTFDRQNIMSDDFIKDTNRQISVKKAWTQFGLLNKNPGITGDTLQKIFADVKASVDKIKARGGQVIFVRPPSSGEMLEAEKMAYPRELYWDKLLAYTNTAGIHFEDYPAITNFICPEWSHLSPKDAIVFTKQLIEILQQEKGWKFIHKNNM